DERTRRIADFKEETADIGLVPHADIPKRPDPFAARRDTEPARRNTDPSPRYPLLLELTPAVDDGKHWVLYTDNTSKRVPIDTDLLRELGLTISRKDIINDIAPARPAEQVIQLHASAAPAARGPARLVFTDAVSRSTITVNWDWSGAAAGTRDQLSAWAGLRASEWTAFDDLGDASLLRTWLDIAPELYGAEIHRNTPRRRTNGQTPPSFLALFGGRAAVQETLQLQLISDENPAAHTATGARTVPIKQVAGVAVKSHPYADMARGKSLPSLPPPEPGP